MASLTGLQKTIERVKKVSTFETEEYREKWGFYFVNWLRWDLDYRNHPGKIDEMDTDELDEFWELFDKERKPILESEDR